MDLKAETSVLAPPAARPAGATSSRITIRCYRHFNLNFYFNIIVHNNKKILWNKYMAGQIFFFWGGGGVSFAYTERNEV